MMNAIELFQPEQSRLAVPAATTVAFVDGVLCEDLEPLEIVRGSWPEFGSARLAYNPAAAQEADPIPFERIEDQFGMGRSVCLHQVYNARPPLTTASGLAVFAGQIDSIETTIDSHGEGIEIIARDFSAVLERITVYGRRVLGDNGLTALLTGLDTTFNPGGQGNAAGETVTVHGKAYAAFSTSAATRSWTYAEAIDYLLSEYLPVGCLHWPDLSQLQALTDHRLVRDLDVTGLSLLEALHRCCEQAGLAFQFVPRLLPTGPSQAILFYRNGQGRAVELNCQPRGETLCLSRTNVTTLRSQRDFYPVTHRYIGQGDFKVYEATFELVKAWDPALEDTDYAKFSASTNPEFYKVRDVYRKWCLNEAGDYTAAPFDQGPPFDFAMIFAGADYVQRGRRFWPALTANQQGRSLGYFLEVSYDDGLHWWEYVYAFDNLFDECGVRLSSDRLDVDTWVAALKDGLKFRITASVVSDERLTSIVANGPVGSTVPVVDHVVTLPRQFRYRQVSAQSVFAQGGPEGFGPPDEADDSIALHELVRRTATVAPRVFETIEVQTPSVTLHLQPGDKVTSSPDSRDLLNVRRDNRSLFWIERVQVDFKQQCTRLQVARQRT